MTLSSDSSRLVVALSTRIQEVEMEDELTAGGRERERGRLYRQLHLGHSQALDPVVTVREIRPSMAILALTRYEDLNSNIETPLLRLPIYIIIIYFYYLK